MGGGAGATNNERQTKLDGKNEITEIGDAFLASSEHQIVDFNLKEDDAYHQICSL